MTPQWRSRLQQTMRSNTADCQYQFWLDQFDLLLQVRLATPDLVCGWITIGRRPALQNIGNKNIGTLIPCREQHFVQQLPGTAYERLTLPVFIRARCFPDYHPLRTCDYPSRTRFVCGTHVMHIGYRLIPVLQVLAIQTTCQGLRLKQGADFCNSCILLRSTHCWTPIAFRYSCRNSLFMDYPVRHHPFAGVHAIPAV